MTALRRVGTSSPRSPAGGEAAALLGLATGIVAHGAVDYVLAFTGHYLLLGFVVGMASAPEAAV